MPGADQVPRLCTITITADLLDFGVRRSDLLNGIFGMTTDDWNALNPGRETLTVHMVVGESYRVRIDPTIRLDGGFEFVTGPGVMDYHLGGGGVT